MSDDPLSLDLASLFRDRHMFDSADSWSEAGFKIVRESMSEKKIMVGRHKKADGLLFKKHLNLMSHDEQLERYERRIEGANMVRTVIEQYGLKQIIVPRKWLYELPSKFARDPSHIVIVDELPIYDRESNKSEQMHRHADLDVIRELCAIWYELRGLDFTAKNMPFTKKGKIAFIDTEHFKWQDERDERDNKKDDRKRQKKIEKKRYENYKKYANRFLTGDRLEFAEEQFDVLSRGR